MQGNSRGGPALGCRCRSARSRVSTAGGVSSRPAQGAAYPPYDMGSDRQQRLDNLRRPSAELPRNQAIALAYADLSQRWTQTELAALYGLSQQRISQIIATYCPLVGRLRIEAATKEREKERTRGRRRRSAARARARRHGTHNRYRHGCRCDRCRAANTRACRESRQRTRSPNAKGLGRQVEANRSLPSAEQAPHP